MTPLPTSGPPIICLQPVKSPKERQEKKMALFPIYGVFKGDFVPHLVAVDTDDSMQQVAEQIAHHSVGRRVPHRPKASGYQIQIGEHLVSPQLLLSQVIGETGLKPLQWVTVDWAQSSGEHL